MAGRAFSAGAAVTVGVFLFVMVLSAGSTTTDSSGGAEFFSTARYVADPETHRAEAQDAQMHALELARIDAERAAAEAAANQSRLQIEHDTQLAEAQLQHDLDALRAQLRHESLRTTAVTAAILIGAGLLLAAVTWVLITWMQRRRVYIVRLEDVRPYELLTPETGHELAPWAPARERQMVVRSKRIVEMDGGK